MKKINCILLCLAACAGLSGCGDLMETAPSNEVDKSLILKDVNAVKVAMNGVYSTMYNRIDFVTANAHQCFGNMAVTLCAEVMGDDMIQTAQGPGWFWKDYNYEARVRYTSKIWRSYFTWKYFYEIISNVNYILSVEHTAAGDENELKCVMAQAYAARAFAYFMLIQSFQQTYKKHETWPGVPVYTEPTTSASKGKGRGTVEQVYTQINDDLTAALTRFEECGIAQEHISNLDYYATSLLKARVALVQNDWATAAEAAAEAMKKPGRSLLSMTDATVVKGTFDDATKNWTTGKTPFNSVASSSVLWGAEMLSEQSTVYASFFSNMDACTDVYYAAETPKCISNWLYAQIPDTDVRKGWWNGNIGIPAEDWSYGANINYNQHKFQWADQKAHKGDYIFMRLEEAYLIRAEALARGYHIITCPCAMHPEDKIDHIIIPSLRLAFLTDNRWHPVRLSAAQTVRCSRFVDRENLSACRARLRFNERAAAELLEQACALMAQAKSCHDELETYYRTAVDFAQVDVAAAQCMELFGVG